MSAPSREEIARKCAEDISDIIDHSPDIHGSVLNRILAAIEEVTRTPNASLPPLTTGPRRKMQVTIEVGADFEKRLDNQWEIEREIHADRYSWQWAPEPTSWKS